MRFYRELNRWWSTVFALDVRSLAAFRIGIGLILLIDIVFRAQTLRAMYTDEGILPRPWMRELWRAFDSVGLQQWGVGSWSLHAISGSYQWQAFLFVMTGIFALMMAAGFYTRIVTVASFILLVSIHSRIPIVLTSGDTHLRIVMFWAMFLPLGRVWSVDALRGKNGHRPQPSKVITSTAAAGLVVQLFILYFFSGLAKWNEPWWNGQAIEMAIKLTIYNTDWSQSFLQYPGLIRVLSVTTVVAEVFLPWLLFVSFRNSWWRGLNLVTFVTMHLGITCILTIGLFSYICCIVWIAVIPGSFWDRLGLATELSNPASSTRAETISAWSYAVPAYCGIMILFMLIWNVINIDQRWFVTPIPDPARPEFVKEYRETPNPLYHAFEIYGHALGVGQHFQMFGFPPTEDAWFVYRATLRDGSVRDIFLGGREFRENKPLAGRSSIPNHHWRQVHRNLTDGTAYLVRQRLAAYAVEQWNKTHSADEQVDQMRLECYLDRFWPHAIPGEARGAVIWGTYPDGPINAFDAMLNRSALGGKSQGF